MYGVDRCSVKVLNVGKILLKVSMDGAESGGGGGAVASACGDLLMMSLF